MNIGTQSPAQTSFIGRMTKWLPSLPSLPSVPAIPSSCKKAFQTLTSSFQSSVKPLPKENVVDLTNATASVTPSKQPTRRWLVVAAATAAVSSLAILGYCRYYLSKTPQSVDEQPPTQDLDLAVSSLAEPMGRRLLSAVPLSLASSLSASLASAVGNYIFGTEELPLSQTYKVWDFFPTTEGRLTVSTPTLPPGLSLTTQQSYQITSVSVKNIQVTAAKDNAVYAGTSNSGVIQIYDASVLSTSYVGTPQIPLSRNLNVGNVMSSMITSGNQLIMAGANTLLKIFDISNPFSPIPQVTIPTNQTVNAIAAGPNNQFVCATSSGFYYLNGTTGSITGQISGLNGFSVVASDSCYFIGTFTGITSVTAIPSSTPISSLPIGNVASLAYVNGYCLVGTPTNFCVVDVRNPSNMTIVYSIPVTVATIITSWLLAGNIAYYSAGTTGFNIMDISNITNPITIASGMAPSTSVVYNLLPLGNNLALRGNNVLNFVTSQDTVTISGTPQPGSKGIHNLTLQATNFNGQLINETASLTVDVQPVITPITPLQKIIAAVGQVVTTILPTTAFTHAGNLPMTYSLICPPGSSVINSISLNPITGQFSGTPQIGDVGSATCVVEASDKLSAAGSSGPFDIQVVHGPTLSTIPNQIALVGQPYSLNLNATSQDPSSNFTYTFTNLPPSFTYTNGILSGTATSQSLATYPVTVTATDQNRISTTQSFLLSVAQPGAPVFVNGPLAPKTVYTTNSFSFPVPPGTAVCPYDPNAQVTYSARLEGSDTLPTWMSFDGTTFQGKPPISVKLYNDVTFSIVLTSTCTLANGQQTATSSNFAIVVSGTSLGQVLLATLTPGGIIAGYAYRNRKVIYNKWVAKEGCLRSSINRIKSIFRCCCFKSWCIAIEFHEVKKSFFEGQSLEYTFKTPPEQIKKLKAFHDGKLYSKDGQLPRWLEEIESEGVLKISAQNVQNLKGVKSFKIVAKDKKGYSLETVTFTRLDQAAPSHSTVQISSPTSSEAVIVELTPPLPSADHKD